jgi:pimeloyl-ACP methyl ester carboxylesterase
MKKGLMIAVAVLTPVLLVVVLTQSAAASAVPHATVAEGEETLSADDTECVTGTQKSEAEYLICTPADWEAGDDLLVYAHGYMAPDRDIETPEDQMVIDGISITETVTSLGYAFATTSYSENGLAVRPAISDLLDLVNIFTTTWGTPNHLYLVGVSEGGLITALSVEEHPEVYDGGLAMCGPYGDFRGQINHFGDFRVVFDYFFPGLMTGSAITIPESLVQDWESGALTATIEEQVEASENLTKVTDLLQVTGVSPYGYDPPTSTESILNLLWYNVYATEDAKEKLGGQPLDNRNREYTGSSDDVALNVGVERFTATLEAVEVISEGYQTTGNLRVPLVTLHTTGDPVVPYWHATQYASKTVEAGAESLHAHIRVERHGHCSFGQWEILGAFGRLVDMVSTRYRVFLPATLKGG